MSTASSEMSNGLSMENFKSELATACATALRAQDGKVVLDMLPTLLSSSKRDQDTPKKVYYLALKINKLYVQTNTDIANTPHRGTFIEANREASRTIFSAISKIIALIVTADRHADTETYYKNCDYYLYSIRSLWNTDGVKNCITITESSESLIKLYRHFTALKNENIQPPSDVVSTFWSVLATLCSAPNIDIPKHLPILTELCADWVPCTYAEKEGYYPKNRYRELQGPYHVLEHIVDHDLFFKKLAEALQNQENSDIASDAVSIYLHRLSAEQALDCLPYICISVEPGTETAKQKLFILFRERISTLTNPEHYFAQLTLDKLTKLTTSLELINHQFKYVAIAALAAHHFKNWLDNKRNIQTFELEKAVKEIFKVKLPTKFSKNVKENIMLAYANHVCPTQRFASIIEVCLCLDTAQTPTSQKPWAVILEQSYKNPQQSFEAFQQNLQRLNTRAELKEEGDAPPVVLWQHSPAVARSATNSIAMRVLTLLSTIETNMEKNVESVKEFGELTDIGTAENTFSKEEQCAIEKKLTALKQKCTDTPNTHTTEILRQMNVWALLFNVSLPKPASVGQAL